MNDSAANEVKLTFTQELLRDISERISPEKFFHNALWGLRRIIHGIDSMVLFTIAQESGMLQVKQGVNIPQHVINTFARKIGSEFIGEIIYNKKNIILNSFESDSKEYQDLKFDNDFKSAMVISVSPQNLPVGFILITSQQENNFTDSDLEFAESIAALCSIELQIDFYIEKCMSLIRRDEETGFLHFNAFFEEARKAYHHGAFHNTPLSFIVIDMDNFKSYCHTHSINAGHELFKNYSKTIRSNLDKVDIIGRFGVDQLIICLIKTDYDSMPPIINRLKEVTEAFSKTHPAPETRISIGATSLSPEKDEFEPAKIVTKLNTALLKAKRNISDKFAFESYT